jgi:hypothetical protein
MMWKPLLTETTRSDVGGKHDGTATRLELGENPITLLLGPVGEREKNGQQQEETEMDIPAHPTHLSP